MSQTELTPRVARRLFVRTVGDALVSPIKETPQRTTLSETSSVNAEASAEPDSMARANLVLERWLAQAAVQLGQLAWQINSDQARATILRVTSHLVILAVLIGAVGMAGAARAATPVAQTGRQVASSGDPGRNVSFNVFPTGQPVTNTEENLTFVGQGGPILIDQAVVAPLANPYTTIPNRQRRDIIRYTVQAGDTLFGIAALYGLTPESLLWANYEALQDNPHLLKTGMELNIPPVNGIVYTVESGDTVESIAEKYKATTDAIYQDGYEWNQLKAGQQPQVGAVLVIPGGSREFKSWALTQADNSPSSTGASVAGVPVANNSNAGFCPDVQAGLTGTGTFIWPADQHWVSGNNYAPWHPGIDIAAHMGDPIYAADNGVVVYAGWNTWGYGNLVVIDHGNGWQTWYAHNSALYVGCGQNVFQGSVISAAGSTGRSTGPHLHFETRLNGTLPNPFNVLPPP
jgi:murein DD-endopeptidase MepM/ murein hydrolase activator NlpD